MIKEAIIVVVDVSPSLEEREFSAGVTGLDKVKTALRLLIQQKLLFGKKDVVGLILVGTEDTQNQLNDEYEGNYEHVTQRNDLFVPDISFLELIDGIQCENGEGDIFDGILVAMHALKSFCGTRKWKKTIYLMLDGLSVIHDLDQLDDIAAQFVNMSIGLNVIGVGFSEVDEEDEEMSLNFDNEKYNDVSVKIEGRPYRQVTNERLIRKFADKVSGIVFAGSEALQLLGHFQSKTVKQMSKMRACFEIASNIRIPVWTYGKTMTATLPSLKKSSVLAEQAGDDVKQNCDVKMDRAYVNKLQADGDEGELEGVDPENRIRAYRYGRDQIPFSQHDLQAMKDITLKCIKVLAFMNKDKIPRHYSMSGVDMVVAPPGDDSAGLALSAMIHACFETDKVILVRYVKRANSAPILAYMEPKIKATAEFFYLNQLPFSEDIRTYPFASLMKNDCRPSESQLDAAEKLINSMDLMTAHVDEDGDECEALKPKLTFNPVLQRFYQALQSRALDDQAPIGDLDPKIAQYVNPSKHILERSSDSVKEFVEQFPLEKAPEKERAVKKNWQDMQKLVQQINNNFANMSNGGVGDDMKDDMSDVDTNAPLTMAQFDTSRVTKISTITPVEDFQAMWKQRDDVTMIDKAIKMMWEIIHKLVDESFKYQLFPKAINCVKALRTGCTQEDEWKKFNDGLKELREKYETKKATFWTMIITENILPINDEECQGADFTPQSASSFFSLSLNTQDSNMPQAVDNDMGIDDLFDDLE